MAVQYKVPFFSNTADGTHCVQASLRMMLKYFEPTEDFSWPELEQITAKHPGKATWKSAMWKWLASRGYELKIIEGFNAQRFIAEGGAYLQDEFGPETAAWQIENSDVPAEQKLYKELLQVVSIENRIPVLHEIEHYLDEGYLVDVSINSRTLAGNPGYVGHEVLVIGYDETTVTIHDPGLPPIENRVVGKKEFEAAWADPNDNAKMIFALKLK